MKMSEPLQPTLWPETELASMSSAGGSRARTLAKLARGLVSRARALVCGVNTRALLASYDPVSQSWKTSQACLVSGWEEFSETWPRSGLMLGGNVFQQPPLAPLTDEIGFGLLPTPTADACVASTPTLEMAERFRRKSQSGSFVEAFAAKVLWPTPTASEAIRTFRPIKWRGRSPRITSNNGIEGQARIGDVLGGPPSPTWIAWLMGFPLAWLNLDYEPSATRSSRKSRS